MLKKLWSGTPWVFYLVIDGGCLCRWWTETCVEEVTQLGLDVKSLSSGQGWARASWCAVAHWCKCFAPCLSLQVECAARQDDVRAAGSHTTGTGAPRAMLCFDDSAESNKVTDEWLH